MSIAASTWVYCSLVFHEPRNVSHDDAIALSSCSRSVAKPASSRIPIHASRRWSRPAPPPSATSVFQKSNVTASMVGTTCG
jgi:hypothetical protein